MKSPAFQHYTGDWRKDPAVQACGLEARGLWFEMMNLMHESPDRGYLLVGSGRPMSVPQLARAAGSSPARVKRLLAELGPDGAGVYSVRDADGAIFCRRMVREKPRPRTEPGVSGWLFVLENGAGLLSLRAGATVPEKLAYKIRSSSKDPKVRVVAKATLDDLAAAQSELERTVGPAGGWRNWPADKRDFAVRYLKERNGGAKDEPLPPGTSPGPENATSPPPENTPSPGVGNGTSPPTSPDALSSSSSEKSSPKTPEEEEYLSPKGTAGEDPPPPGEGPTSLVVVPPDPPPGTKAPRKVPDTPHHRAIASFCSAWAAKYPGEKYFFVSGKDGTAVKTILAHLGGDEARFAALVARYLADDEPFFAGNRHDIGTLLSKLNRWVVETPLPRPKRHSNSQDRILGKVLDALQGD